jgi:hypothetical protein
MLNAQEADAAIKALTYPSGITDRDERVAADRAYNEEVSKIGGQFRDWLANTYASSLPATVQARIWSKSWGEGHSSGFGDVENYYIDNADFAQFVFNAVPRPTAG